MPPGSAGGLEKIKYWALAKLIFLAKALGIEKFYDLQLKLEAIEINIEIKNKNIAKEKKSQ